MVSNTQPVQTAIHRLLQYNPVSENITLIMSSVELLNVGSSVFYSLAHHWVSHDMLSTYIISVTYTVNLGSATIPNSQESLKKLLESTVLFLISVTVVKHSSNNKITFYI